jgi:ribosome-binding factor A
MPTKSSRMNKIDEELKKEIGTIISLELKNPHLTGLISVTKVKTTPDLRFAKVYVSMINEKSKKENLAILKQSSGYIRSGIAKKINLRTTPELIFEFDESLEYGSKIDEILKDISKDWKKE